MPADDAEPELLRGLDDDDLARINLVRGSHVTDLRQTLAEMSDRRQQDRTELREVRVENEQLLLKIGKLRAALDQIGGPGTADMFLQAPPVRYYHHPLGEETWDNGSSDSSDGEDEVFVEPERDVFAGAVEREDTSVIDLTADSDHDLMEAVDVVAESDSPASQQLLRDMGYHSPQPAEPQEQQIVVIPQPMQRGTYEFTTLEAVPIPGLDYLNWGLVQGPLKWSPDSPDPEPTCSTTTL